MDIASILLYTLVCFKIQRFSRSKAFLWNNPSLSWTGYMSHMSGKLVWINFTLITKKYTLLFSD